MSFKHQQRSGLQPSWRKRRGLTLIELTVAMAIVGALFGAVVYGVGSLTGSKAKAASAQLAGVIRNLYDTASLTGKTCRIVFSMPEERDENGRTSYRAECAKGAVTASAKRDDELSKDNVKQRDSSNQSESQRRLKRLDDENDATSENLAEQEKRRVEDQTKFASFGDEDIREATLPSNVKLEVWTQKQRSPVKAGLAYLYFFPQGFTEKAQIAVRQGTNSWTLAVASLTGKTVIHSGELEVPR